MLVFPNCKINLGLHVTRKRPDGFHDIETVFYPVSWCDALEIIDSGEAGKPFELSQSGIKVDGDAEDNIIYKAWKIIASQKQLPAIKVHLHKNIPMGAGLGGGSSNAAAFIHALNEKFSLGYSHLQKIDLAAQLGSDCPFFIHNSPTLATGKGDVFSPLQADLSAYHILLAYPNVHSNTKEAYEGLVPKQPQHDLRSVIETQPISRWKDLLVNDFELSIFKKYPAVEALKNNFYAAGALYACMSGSGSAVFGIFQDVPKINFPAGYSYYLQNPGTNIL